MYIYIIYPRYIYMLYIYIYIIPCRRVGSIYEDRPGPETRTGSFKTRTGPEMKNRIFSRTRLDRTGPEHSWPCSNKFCDLLALLCRHVSHEEKADFSPCYFDRCIFEVSVIFLERAEEFRDPSFVKSSPVVNMSENLLEVSSPATT